MTDSCCRSVEIYSEKTKTWKHQYLSIKEWICYCLCSFMNKLYIICGHVRCKKKISSPCYTYDIKINEHDEIVDLNKARRCAACAVFEGKIVNTGGSSRSESSHFSSVEAYGHHENKWTFLPALNDDRFNHAAVSMVCCWRR